MTLTFIRLACLVHVASWQRAFSFNQSGLDEAQNLVEGDDPLFLQVALETQKQMQQEENGTGVVFMHVPYNFGHTIEKVALVPGQDVWQRNLVFVEAMAITANESLTVSERLALLQSKMSPGAKLWGHMHPLLQQRSAVTNCSLYFTPGKYWPEDVAQSYFGQDQIFGLLRDPYERLVAMFRGAMDSYGGGWGPYRASCDVDGAVKKKMQDIIQGKISPFAEGCTFLPQAEFFDGPHGITLPVDNRRFAASANEFLTEHGHPKMHIDAPDIFHVEGCNQVWAGNLSCETKALVRQVFARDFELLCRYFGYCDVHENTCLDMVPDMCPGNLHANQLEGTYCG